MRQVHDGIHDIMQPLKGTRVIGPFSVRWLHHRRKSRPFNSKMHPLSERTA